MMLHRVPLALVTLLLGLTTVVCGPRTGTTPRAAGRGQASESSPVMAGPAVGGAFRHRRALQPSSAMWEAGTGMDLLVDLAIAPDRDLPGRASEGANRAVFPLRTVPEAPDLLQGYQADNDGKHRDSCGEQWRMHGLPPSDRVNRRLARSVLSAPAWRFGTPAWLRFVVQFKLLPGSTRPTG